MTCSKQSTLVLLTTAVVLLDSRSVSAGAGSLTFFKGTNFNTEDGYYKFGIRWPQECYNISAAFNDNVSSVKWEGLVQSGAFDGHAKVALYTGADCSGTVLSWPTTESNFPTNLALDGIDDQLSSFMIWKANKDAREGISRKFLR
ncbi:hypothetical protein BBJ28_00009090 [Nothophytophthora sp. Chile5]|nr:hypothetical protein BBJ28_00009090 [Nothophytophthora sp. Chile5]